MQYNFKGWSRKDYIEFFLSVGGVFGFAILSTILAIISIIYNIKVPSEAYSIPIGFSIFAIAWIFDSIAHRTIYKNKIDALELTYHNFMVYGSGAPLILCFVLAYWIPHFILPFIFTFIFLKSMYSIIDEVCFHLPRMKSGRSDVIEMTAHCIQFAGNILYDFGWLYWIYCKDYAGAGSLFTCLTSLV